MASDPAAPTGNSELVVGIMHWLRVARYRRNTIMQIMCVAAMLGAAYYAFAPRYYQATAKLLIIQRNQDQMATVGEQPSLDNTMATHQELVTSPIVVQSAIEQLLPEHRVDFADSLPSDWSEKLARRLSARTTRKTNFIQLSYRSLSPEAAAAVVSSVVQSYLHFVEGTHKGTASEVLEGLTHELEVVERGLAEKQHSLQEFRQQVGSLTVRKDDGIIDPTIQNALRLNESRATVQEQRVALESQLESIQLAIREGGDLQPYLAGLEETIGKQMMSSALGLSTEDLSLIKDQQQKLFEAQNELQALAPFFGPAHPKVVEVSERIRSIENFLLNYRTSTGNRLSGFNGRELGSMIEAMLQQSVAQARRREQQLEESFRLAHADAVRESGGLVDLETREREVARLERQQDILLDKIANIDLRQLQAPIQATVVEEPLPNDRPVSPQLRLVIVGSLLGGLLVGGLVVYVQDILDDRFASPEEMTAQLGVQTLALVRRLKPIDGCGLAAVHTFAQPNSVEAESFRTLRTALTLSGEVTDRVLVSSAEPGDGKTTVTANLAVSFAQSGKRTLVIDADLRKPGMTALMQLKGRPGLSDVLQADFPMSEIASQLVQTTELTGLDVLPAGPRQSNPAELLSGPRLGELLAWAESCYDQVLVDCPPVLAVSDAQVVGRLVDGAILVAQPEKNHRQLVIRACESFKATGSPVLGVVANGLSAVAGSGYGYGYNYGYGYGYGHDADEAEEAEETVPLYSRDSSLQRKAA
jgi:capsular exopolysaccharide synthesis family protein